MKDKRRQELVKQARQRVAERVIQQSHVYDKAQPGDIIEMTVSGRLYEVQRDGSWERVESGIPDYRP